MLYHKSDYWCKLDKCRGGGGGLCKQLQKQNSGGGGGGGGLCKQLQKQNSGGGGGGGIK
jgi:hypothetical protein